MVVPVGRGRTGSVVGLVGRTGSVVGLVGRTGSVVGLVGLVGLLVDGGPGRVYPLLSAGEAINGSPPCETFADSIVDDLVVVVVLVSSISG